MPSGKILFTALAGLLLAMLSIGAFAQAAQKEYHIKLLAVSENGTGVTADMFLRVVPGNGNVFIEAEPVTKLDTRISTKLAKDIACESLPALTDKCKNRDFFYRIEANASLIGGPSAGAAAATLAIAAVEDIPIDQSVAVTGTMNTGGLVGQVGGLKGKIDAAVGSGITRVLIPLGEAQVNENISSPIDLISYGKSKGVNVVEAGSISDVLLYITGRNYSSDQGNLKIDEAYSQIMGKLADDMCERTKELSSKASLQEPGSLTSDTPSSILEVAKNLSSQGLDEKAKKNYYSGASLCFGANVRLVYLNLVAKNETASNMQAQADKLKADIGTFEEQIPEINTVAGLQVRGIIKDRLDEAKQLIENSHTDISTGDYNDGVYQFAFAGERFASAKAWDQFMTAHSRPLSVNNESLREGCTVKIKEADEYIQYLNLYFADGIQGSELNPAYSYLRDGDYSACIYRASLSKAKANAMLAAIGSSSNITQLVDRKLGAARESIARQTKAGDFPIVSYSYYEYANTLKESDPPSALLFSEYALELSNLKSYLGDSQAGPAQTEIVTSLPKYQIFAPLTAIALIVGFAGGIIISAAIVYVSKHMRGRKKKVILSRSKVINPGIAPRGAILGKKR